MKPEFQIDIEAPLFFPRRVSQCTNVALTSVNQWIARNHLIIASEGRGQGNVRRFSALDAAKVAIMKEVTSLRIPASVAGRFAADIATTIIRDASPLNWDACCFIDPSSMDAVDLSGAVSQPPLMVWGGIWDHKAIARLLLTQPYYRARMIHGHHPEGTEPDNPDSVSISEDGWKLLSTYPLWPAHERAKRHDLPNPRAITSGIFIAVGEITNKAMLCLQAVHLAEQEADDGQ